MALTQPLLPDTLTDNPGCSLIRTEDPLAAGEFVARLGLNRFKRCRRLDLTGGSRLDALFYKTLEEELTGVFSSTGKPAQAW